MGSFHKRQVASGSERIAFIKKTNKKPNKTSRKPTRERLPQGQEDKVQGKHCLYPVENSALWGTHGWHHWPRSWDLHRGIQPQIHSKGGRNIPGFHQKPEISGEDILGESCVLRNETDLG